MSRKESFLGRGWSFPPEFKINSNEVAMVSDEEDIRQSLRILLSTRPGERLMQPDYGCGIHQMVFESMNTSFESYARNLIKTAILRYESRINLEKVDFEYESRELDGILYIYIEYTVRMTNTRSNIVYPFYLKEGTNVKQ